VIPRSLSLWIVQHPRFILIGAAIVTAVAFVCAMQLTPNVSIRAMLADDAPSAVALDRIAGNFHSMDELLLVASLPVGTAGIHEEATPRLLNFANRLRDHIDRSPNLRSMVA
jgi:predicted RND superfamily exporter protein